MKVMDIEKNVMSVEENEEVEARKYQYWISELDYFRKQTERQLGEWEGDIFFGYLEDSQYSYWLDYRDTDVSDTDTDDEYEYDEDVDDSFIYHKYHKCDYDE